MHERMRDVYRSINVFLVTQDDFLYNLISMYVEHMSTWELYRDVYLAKNGLLDSLVYEDADIKLRFLPEKQVMVEWEYSKKHIMVEWSYKAHLIADFMPKDKWGETIVTSYDSFMFRFGLMFKYKRDDIVKEYLELIKAGKLQELLRDRINTMG